MQHGLELPLSRDQSIKRDIFPPAEPQLPGIQPVAAIVPQQPRVDAVGLGLDPLRRAEGLDPLRVNDGPADRLLRQRVLQVPFKASAALEHYDVLCRIELLYQSRD